MNKQELIKKVEQMGEYEHFVDEPISKKGVLNILNQLDEPEKVKVPQFVADWIENVKENGLLKENFSGNRIGISVGDDVQRVLYFIFQKRIVEGEVLDWILDNTNTFARAWLDGYEVKKEKRYRVRMKGANPRYKHLKKGTNGDWLFGDVFASGDQHYTRKELEEANFGWVFDCPGIEIEEVE